MIDAMPSILKRRADAVYVVLGATHPNLVREQGEAYRESLMARVRELGVEDHVVFLDQFVDQATLLEFISMCDIYVTPYLNEAQMTSGTLAYSFGLGKPVVSTPYWHARELLADGRGVLVHWLKVVARTDPAAFDPHSPAAAPDMQIRHFLSMCDDTGLFQHAVHSVPDRSHGYCVDDNARALLLACALNNPGEQRLSEVLTARFAAFVQHAWNPDTRRFRNFMGFSRTWLEASGSEDSHARTLWALGESARSDLSPSRRRWAASLFAEALPTAEAFRSPRAWAFTLLGLDAYCAAAPDDLHAREVRPVLADRLMTIFASVETPDWVWFEEGLAYDNARLPQALMVTGMATQTPGLVDAGLRSLRWLMKQQTTSMGHFRPVGTAGFGEQRKRPRAFDQQPVEATATIAACLTAWRAEGDAEWKAMATNVFAWFLGNNDLSVALVDLQTGSCRDGLHPDRANENRGGESVVSYLLGLAEIRQLARVNAGLTKPPALRAVGA